MKGRRAILVMAFMSVAGAGFSQERIPQPPIKPEEIGKYCIYGSRIYSNGSQICAVRGGPSLGCDKGEWKVDLTKFGLDCRTESLTTGERR
jgi:hypothetical protein